MIFETAKFKENYLAAKQVKDADMISELISSELQRYLSNVSSKDYAVLKQKLSSDNQVITDIFHITDESVLNDLKSDLKLFLENKSLTDELEKNLYGTLETLLNKKHILSLLFIFGSVVFFAKSIFSNK